MFYYILCFIMFSTSYCLHWTIVHDGYQPIPPQQTSIILLGRAITNSTALPFIVPIFQVAYLILSPLPPLTPHLWPSGSECIRSWTIITQVSSFCAQPASTSVLTWVGEITQMVCFTLSSSCTNHLGFWSKILPKPTHYPFSSAVPQKWSSTLKTISTKL